MQDQGLELWSGSVDSWECDTNGHMNVRFYVAKHMEALATLAAELGMPRAFSQMAEATMVVREQHIRFMREAHPAAGLYITGGVVEMGESDARVLTVMHHLSGEVAAVFQTVVEHVTARELRPFAWPARVRDRAQACRVTVPADLAPRSLGLAPVVSIASAERAQALGLARGAYGVVAADACDAFGRMRTEMFMSRIIQGVARVVRGRPSPPQPGVAGAPKIGGAVLEYRLVYFAWPRAGDRIEMRSGTAWADHRFRRLVHWLIDPDSGKVWATAEAVTANLDLELRKLVSFTPEEQAAIQTACLPELAL